MMDMQIIDWYYILYLILSILF